MSGLAANSVFKSKNGLNGVRKAISITYHPDNTPFTITTGYSGSFGPSLTVNYRIFFNKKKDKEKIKNKESQLTKKSASNKPTNTSSTKKSSTRALMYPPSTIIAAKNANKDSNKSTTKEPIQEKAADSDKKQAEEKAQQAKQAAEKAAADAKKKAEKAAADAKKRAEKAAADAKKRAEKAMADAKKLCDESEVLYPLNMYNLSSSEKKNLQKLAQYLKTNPKIKLQIFGSTDKSGSEEYNLKLGSKRTNSSENYLIQLGVSSKQLETINLGESKSQNSNSKQERAKARSTTYKIIPLLP
jgi:outer membrane protein OmpA-like peptidoglycan-associated protein